MKTIQLFDKDQICKMFGCTREQLNAQYAKNADGLNSMREKAAKTGKKVNGYTEKQLAEHADRYKSLSHDWK